MYYKATLWIFSFLYDFYNESLHIWEVNEGNLWGNSESSRVVNILIKDIDIKGVKVQGPTGLKITHGSLLSIKEIEVAIRLIIREAYQTKIHILLMIPGFIPQSLGRTSSSYSHVLLIPAVYFVSLVTNAVSLLSHMPSLLKDWFFKRLY